MRKVLIYLTLSLLAFLLPLVISPVVFSTQEKTPSLETLSGSILKTTLPNGMTVIIKQMADKDIASMELMVNTGSATEAEFTGSGISHFVEHMLFKGPKTRSTGEIQKQIKSLGGNFNAYTSHDYTGYYIVVGDENFSPALEILSDVTINSEFDAAELEKEREVILKEIAMGQDDPDKHLSKLIWSTAYTTHPYRHPVIGYEDTLRQLSRNDLINYYSTYYIPNNMILSIVSPIEPSSVLSEVKDAFKDFRRKSLKPTVLPEEPPQIGYREYQEQRDVKLARLAFCYHTIAVSHPDLFALDLLAIILGQGESSRLNQKIHKDARLAYAISSYNYTPKYPGIFTIDATLEEENIDKTKEAILNEVNLARDKKVTQKELDKARRQLLSGYIFGLESPRGQTRQMAMNELLLADPQFSYKYIDQIKAVTPARIQQVARKYLNTQNLSVITLVPKKDVKQATAAVIKKSGIKKTVLKNGATLLTLEDAKLPVVTIQACFLGGARFENESNIGISNILSTMLTKGTKQMSSKQLAERLESLGIAASSYGGNNSFGLSMKLLKEDLAEGLDIFSKLITEPAFKATELEIQKSNVIAAIKAREENIFRHGSKTLKETLFTTHPYRFQNIGTAESVENLTVSDLKNFHRKFCTSKNLVLAIFGDIKEGEAKSLADQYFAGIPAGSRPTGMNIAEPKLEEIRKSIKHLPKQQALVILGFPGVSVYDKDRHALEVLSLILSGDAGRLYEQIRQKYGQSYTLGAYPVFGLDPGYFLMYAATTPEHSKSIKEEMLRQARMLGGKPVTDEELATTKKQLISFRKMALQTNSKLAFASCIDELYGLGFNNYTTYEAKINAVTKRDIMRVAKKYLKKNAHACVEIKPGDK